MLVPALEYLRKTLEKYIGDANVDVSIASARKLVDQGNPAGIVISLINVQEETALKNTPNVRRTGPRIEYVEPPVYLNLYLLFAFDFAKYETGLAHLAKTIELFQQRHWFSAENSVPGNPFPAELEKLNFEMVNLSFEELNNLWSVLGGTCLPSVVYKVRLVRIEGSQTLEASEITTIGLKLVRP
jgi:hypothetical protein